MCPVHSIMYGKRHGFILTLTVGKSVIRYIASIDDANQLTDFSFRQYFSALFTNKKANINNVILLLETIFAITLSEMFKRTAKTGAIATHNPSTIVSTNKWLLNSS